jgi:hypothetical protein
MENTALGYFLRRLVRAVLVLLGVTFATFLVAHTTGDPVTLLVPGNATVEARAQLAAHLLAWINRSPRNTACLSGAPCTATSASRSSTAKVSSVSSPSASATRFCSPARHFPWQSCSA